MSYNIRKGQTVERVGDEIRSTEEKVYGAPYFEMNKNFSYFLMDRADSVPYNRVTREGMTETTIPKIKGKRTSN